MEDSKNSNPENKKNKKRTKKNKNKYKNDLKFSNVEYEPNIIIYFDR